MHNRVGTFTSKTTATKTRHYAFIRSKVVGDHVDDDVRKHDDDKGDDDDDDDDDDNDTDNDTDISSLGRQDLVTQFWWKLPFYINL